MNAFVSKLDDFLSTDNHCDNYLGEKKSQGSINKSACTPDMPLEAVNELFFKISKNFSDRTRKSEKIVYRYLIQLKHCCIKIKLYIISTHYGYWLCKIDNAKFYCDGIYLSSFFNEKNSIVGTPDISFNKTSKCSIIKLTHTVSNKLETEFILVTRNFLIYPIHKDDFLNNRFFLKKTFSEYIFFCKDFIYVYYYILIKLKEEVSINDILYCNDSFPNNIKCKIKSLCIVLEPSINCFNRLNKEHKKLISTIHNIKDFNVLNENMNIVLDEIKTSLNIFYQIDNNWKVFVYAFIKDCYIYI